MARVDFPLECSFELNRHYYEYTITIVQVRERYTDVRILKKERKKEEMSASMSYSMSYRDKTSNERRTKNGNRLCRIRMTRCVCVLPQKAAQANMTKKRKRRRTR